MEMGCCGCFGFSRWHKGTVGPRLGMGNLSSPDQHFLGYDDFYDVGTNIIQGDDCPMPCRARRSEEVLRVRLQRGLTCRQNKVKETHHLVRSEVQMAPRDRSFGNLGSTSECGGDTSGKADENGTKKINEYVRVCKIGAGSYGKVVLYRSSLDGKDYAVKAFHKSHLSKQRVSPSETAMTDVLREVQIMKMLSHPNIVNLIEVIDDSNTDNFYMVLEYVEGKWDCDGSGPPGGVGEATARKYMRDIVSGLIYLHSHNIVHLDIKPQNLLVSSNGSVKIADFSVSQAFEGDNDELRRSPGTPVMTAPECCSGLPYRGKAADTWAVGVTLYCMVTGSFPFIGETLQDQYDKIVNDPLLLPGDLNPQLQNLLEGLLCKDPKRRITLNEVAEHPWVIAEDGLLPEFLCWCKQNSSRRNGLEVLE